MRALRRDPKAHVRHQHASSPGTSARGHGRNTFHLSPTAFGAAQCLPNRASRQQGSGDFAQDRSESASGERPGRDISHILLRPVLEPASAAAQAPAGDGSQAGRPQSESTVGAGQGTWISWTVDKRSDKALNSFVASNRTVKVHHLAGSRYPLVRLLLGCIYVLLLLSGRMLRIYRNFQNVFNQRRYQTLVSMSYVQ